MFNSSGINITTRTQEKLLWCTLVATNVTRRVESCSYLAVNSSKVSSSCGPLALITDVLKHADFVMLEGVMERIGVETNRVVGAEDEFAVRMKELRRRPGHHPLVLPSLSQ